MLFRSQNELTVRSRIQPDGTLGREQAERPGTRRPENSGVKEADRVTAETIKKPASVAANIEMAAPTIETKPTAAAPELPAAQAELSESIDFQGLSASLKRRKSEGVLQYGKKSDFLLPEKCWVYLINPATRQVEHALAPGAGARKDWKTGKTLADFEQSSSGLIAVWVQFN